MRHKSPLSVAFASILAPFALYRVASAIPSFQYPIRSSREQNSTRHARFLALDPWAPASLSCGPCPTRNFSIRFRSAQVAAAGSPGHPGPALQRANRGELRRVDSPVCPVPRHAPSAGAGRGGHQPVRDGAGGVARGQPVHADPGVERGPVPVSPCAPRRRRRPRRHRARQGADATSGGTRPRGSGGGARQVVRTGAAGGAPHVRRGARLMEAMQLRVKDLDFTMREITLRRAKGSVDRVTMLPEAVLPELESQLERVRRLHQRDLARGGGRHRCLERTSASRRGRRGSGSGSSCFRRHGAPSTRGPANTAVTRCTSRWSSGRFGGRCSTRGLRNGRRVIASGIRLRLTSCRMGMTFGRFRSCWAIVMWRRR